MKNQPPPAEEGGEGSIKKSISLPISLYNRAIAKDPSISKVVQDALTAYLDRVLETDKAIEALQARLTTIEGILGARLTPAVALAPPATPPTNIARFPRRTSERGTVYLPVLGNIAAGDGDSVVDLTEYYVEVPMTIADGASFILRVKGDSMNKSPEGIVNGCAVLMALGLAEEGKIVAALVDGKTTLKRVELENGRFMLKSESDNPAHGKIYALEELRVQGVFVGIVPPEIMAAGRVD